MDPVTLVVIPGFLGGLVIALVVRLLQRRDGPQPSVVVREHLPLTTDVINMGSIKVAGVGGLGLVAMAVAVALDIRRIGETVALGLACGCVIAVVMIVARRRSGALPSSGRGPGGNRTLAIDEPRGDTSHARADHHLDAKLLAPPAVY